MTKAIDKMVCTKHAAFISQKCLKWKEEYPVKDI